MLTKILDQHTGVRVVAAVGDGLSAIDKLAELTIDVVILDVEMPKMDGLTALPIIIKKSPGIQVLMSSTFTLRSAEVTLQALNLGAADYVAKPSTKDKNNSLETFTREILYKVKVLGPIAKSIRKKWPRLIKNTLMRMLYHVEPTLQTGIKSLKLRLEKSRQRIKTKRLQ